MRKKEVKKQSHLRTIPANDLLGKVWQPKGKLTGSAKLIGKHEVLEMVPINYVTLWRRMTEGSFPRCIALGQYNYWKKNEVEAWLAEQPLRRLKHDRSRAEENA